MFCYGILERGNEIGMPFKVISIALIYENDIYNVQFGPADLLGLITSSVDKGIQRRLAFDYPVKHTSKFF